MYLNFSRQRQTSNTCVQRSVKKKHTINPQNRASKSRDHTTIYVILIHIILFMIRYFLFTLLFVLFQNNNLSWGYSPSKRNSTGRRDFLSFFTKETAAFAFSVSTTTATVTSTSAANAFENRLDKYSDVTSSQQGIINSNQPTDLGYMKRTSQTTKTSYIGLKPCSTSPNCYCSSTPFSDNMASKMSNMSLIHTK